MYYIYRHVLPDGKSYIGKTQNPKARYQNGKGYRRCPKFDRAIKQYGWENISHEILCKTEEECEARKLEKDMIEKYNSIENGYNSNNKRNTYISQRKKALPKYGQYTLDGKLIKIYIGNKQLWKYGFLSDGVKRCCKGKLKTSQGYVWKFEN